MVRQSATHVGSPGQRLVELRPGRRLVRTQGLLILQGGVRMHLRALWERRLSEAEQMLAREACRMKARPPHTSPRGSHLQQRLERRPAFVVLGQHVEAACVDDRVRHVDLLLLDELPRQRLDAVLVRDRGAASGALGALIRHDLDQLVRALIMCVSVCGWVGWVGERECVSVDG